MKPAIALFSFAALCFAITATAITHDGDDGGDHEHNEAAPRARQRASADRDRMDLRVMSFNIRYGSANDGANNWPARREQVVETIKRFDPDLLGTQEAEHFQAAYLKKELRGYRFHGVGRTDGKTRGEYAAIFYRAGRFKKLDAGHFWLSEQPEKPGSVSWDSSMTRMVSWVLLKDQRTKQTIAYFNTHWDHRGKQARLESGKLMRKRIEQWPLDTAIIVTGDFNTTEDRPPYKALLPLNQNTAGNDKDNAENTAGDKVKHPLTDTYRAIHKERGKNEGTFGGFRGNKGGGRIDWILCSQHFTTRDAAIDYSNKDGKYPSDHYPVTATLEVNAE